MRGKRSFIAAAILSVILLAGITGSASGAEWVYFATTAEGSHYYDKENVKKTNTTVTVWEKTVFSEEARRGKEKFLRGTGEYKGQKLGHSVTVNEFNCRGAKAKSLSMTIYDIDGKRVAGSPAGGSPWRALAPGTLHERLFQLVCP